MANEVVTRCDDCRFYLTHSDTMDATCKLSGNRLMIATASPYRLSAKDAIPPKDCPLRKKPKKISVRIGNV